MNDEFEGQGGSYVVDESGVRTLIHRTAEVSIDQRSSPAPPPDVSQVQDQPASAGFFTLVTPVAPDDATTTTE
ncbi:MAG: hypothetical protein V4463_05205 [Pseudomonadota bacterium]